MTTPVLDTFDRANSTTTLGTADSGHTYTVNGTAGISNNQAYFASTGSNEIALVDFGAADMTVQATSPNLSQNWCLVFRAVDLGNHWQLETFTSGAWQVWHRAAGVWTQRAAGTGAVAGAVWKVACRETRIQVFCNAVLLHTFDATEFQTATLAGIRRGGTSTTTDLDARWDNLSVTDTAVERLVVSHDFTGDTAAGSGLGTADTGQVWRSDVGSWQRLSGTARGTVDGDVASIDVGASDMDVSVQTGALGTYRHYQLLGRFRSWSDFFMAEIRPGGEARLVRRDPGGTWTQLGITAAGTMPSAGGKLGIRCVGTRISMLVNDTVVLSATSTAQPNRGTRAALRHGAWDGTAAVAGVTVAYDTLRARSLTSPLPQAETFTGTDGIPPLQALWARSTSSGANVTQGVLAAGEFKASLPAGGYNGLGLRGTGMDRVENFEVRFDTQTLMPLADRTSWSTAEHYKGFMWAVGDAAWPDTAAGATTCYQLQIHPDGTPTNPWHLAFMRKKDGAITRVLATDARPLSGSVFQHSVRLRVTGNHVQARLWERFTAEPDVWHIDITDTSAEALTGSGVFGFYGVAGANARPELGVTVDNVEMVASKVAPPAVTLEAPAYGLWREPVQFAATSNAPDSVFEWTLNSQPAGSTATLQGASTTTAALTPDAVGVFSGQVKVTAGGLSTTVPFDLTVRAMAWKRVGGARKPMRLRRRLPAALGAYAQAVMADAPVAFWRLEETSGTSAADRAGGRHGAYAGGPLLGQDPVMVEGVSAQFDGIDDHVAVPYAAALNPAQVTVEAWVKRDSNTSHVLRIASSKESGELAGWDLFGGDNILTWNLGAATGAVSVDWAGSMVGLRRHVVGTFDGTTARLFVDGAEVGSAAVAYAPNTTTGTTIGRRSYDSARFWTGRIDEVAVYDKALTAARILAHYDAGKPAEVALPASPAPEPQQLMRTGSRLTATDGATVFPVGGYTSYGMAIYKEASDYNGNYAERVYGKRATWLANMKAEGYNVHRLSVAGNLYNGLPYVNVTQEQYLDRIKAYVDDAAALGIYTLIGDWSALVAFNSWLPEKWTELKPFWTAMIAKLGPNNPWVMYEPHNEPNNEDVLYHGSTHPAMTTDQWRDVMIGTVEHFRAQGYWGPLVIDTPDWSWSFPKTHVDAVLARDAQLRANASVAPGQHQIVVANHIYSNGQSSYTSTAVNSAGETRQQQWEANVYARIQEGYAVLGSEYGFFNGGQSNMAWQKQFFGFVTDTYVPGGMTGYCSFLSGTWGEGNDLNRQHYQDECTSRTEWGELARVTARRIINPGTTLWKGDTSKTLPTAFAFNYVNSSYASLGSMWTSSSIPNGGLAFRSVIPTTGSQGYRAHNELDLVAPTHFPRQSVKLSYWFRVLTKGGMETTDCKVGFGLVGAPAGATNNDISYGGTKLDTSWSARTTLVPANYLGGTHPWCMAYYLYAEYAGGQTYSQYGLRKAYRREGDGAYFTPAQGVWYLHEVELHNNSAGGVRDGIYRAWVDGVLYVNLTDVQWSKSGFDVPISHLMTQTFGNDNITAQAEFDQSNPTLTTL